MTMVVANESSSLHQEDETKATTLSSCENNITDTVRQRPNNCSDPLDGGASEQENDTMCGSVVEDDKTEEEDDDEQQSDYLVNSHLNRDVQNKLSLNTTVSSGERNIMNATLNSSFGSQISDLDRSLKDHSSVHSQTRTPCSAEGNAWNTLDSVHTCSSTNPHNNMTDLGNASMDFNDSCCSFASFGDSSSNLSDSNNAELNLQRAAFTRLNEEPTPRRVLMKTHSLRMKRGISFRGTALSLIEESASLEFSLDDNMQTLT